ncbi:MAG TPA: hypothetical protein IAB50_02945 [Candidatus Faecivicinus avistercoris]|nr:hypothetical protein [Candidatus Faecivicinus avistercoris]
MRRGALIALLTAAAVLLGGCSEIDQAENLAFVVLMGVDQTEDGGIELSVQVPKISGSRGNGEDSGSSGDLVFTASGGDFAEAITALKWIVPRRLDLSQIELIVVSEALASSGRWLEVMNDMMQTSRLYTAARLAVCDGDVQAFIRAEKPLIGTRIADELTAMFEAYTTDGFVPNTSFADIYYKSISAYSDPVAVYAVPAPEESSADVEPASQDAAEPAVAIIPDDPGTTDVETEQETRFLGAAVFRDGRMVGKLDGRTLMYCKLLRGKSQTFVFAHGGEEVSLSTLGTPSVSVDTASEPVRIQVDLRLAVLPNNGPLEYPGLADALEAELMKAVDACKAIGAEPFQFAEVAARRFATLDDWIAYGWRERFIDSEVEINVDLKIENL